MELPPGWDENTLRDYYYACNKVSEVCPVEATTLGYFPNRSINYFFAVAYGLAAAVTFGLGVWKRTWSYMAFITAGCVLEMVGKFYLLRVKGGMLLLTSMPRICLSYPVERKPLEQGSIRGPDRRHHSGPYPRMYLDISYASACVSVTQPLTVAGKAAVLSVNLRLARRVVPRGSSYWRSVSGNGGIR